MNDRYVAVNEEDMGVLENRIFNTREEAEDLARRYEMECPSLILNSYGVRRLGSEDALECGEFPYHKNLYLVKKPKGSVSYSGMDSKNLADSVERDDVKALKRENDKLVIENLAYKIRIETLEDEIAALRAAHRTYKTNAERVLEEEQGKLERTIDDFIETNRRTK